MKDAIGRGLVSPAARRSDRAGGVPATKEALVRFRPRLRDTGYLWMITRKRGHENYLNQMSLVPFAKRLGLIDNKTCSIDDERSGIRFVIPRTLRRTNHSAAYSRPAGLTITHEYPRCPHAGAGPALRRGARARSKGACRCDRLCS